MESTLAGPASRDVVSLKPGGDLLSVIVAGSNGALGALSGVRNEIEAQLRGFLERWLKAQNLVTREEFEVVKEMASRARTENERLLGGRNVRLDRSRTGAPAPGGTAA